MQADFLGWDHPQQASTLHDIAKIHVKRRRWNKALHLCDIVLGIRKDCLPKTHIDIARTLTTKGACWIALGDTKKAGKCLTEALSLVEHGVGAGHPCAAEIHAEFGALHLRKCEFAEARKCIQKALDIYCWSELDDDYPGILDAKERLERIERDEMLCV